MTFNLSAINQQVSYSVSDGNMTESQLVDLTVCDFAIVKSNC